jgi:hypothetical protein
VEQLDLVMGQYLLRWVLGLFMRSTRHVPQPISYVGMVVHHVERGMEWKTTLSGTGRWTDGVGTSESEKKKSDGIDDERE